ncbi:uncharacterized protein [Oryctolagus cuniculus]|uniref:uncharacterized protein n=1 Tax=Oryctolagus cuniculus TaxID=9986 RepID=UPI00387946A9
MGKLLEKYKAPNPTEEEIDNLNRLRSFLQRLNSSRRSRIVLGNKEDNRHKGILWRTTDYRWLPSRRETKNPTDGVVMWKKPEFSPARASWLVVPVQHAGDHETSVHIRLRQPESLHITEFPRWPSAECRSSHLAGEYESSKPVPEDSFHSVMIRIAIELRESSFVSKMHCTYFDSWNDLIRYIDGLLFWFSGHREVCSALGQ